ncbi:hypothetical protein [Altererythrobacter sp. ZODW24]|uniref:hypothetical protein n=1 Tax=Altererythrobacter sp. ZODW24 TaxID=2185142 RepID=UPI001F083454|nr:hypothetical protein [Altererythrobacter sp. ZODW24]
MPDWEHVNMVELVQANWPLFVIALLIGIAVAWYIFVANRRTRVETDKRDVMDEDAAPAARNQALIDSAPAAAPIIPSAGVGAAGAAISTAVQEQTAAVEATPVSLPVPADDPTPSAPQTDDLARIKGVGPKLRTMLGDMGVTTVAQIAAWSDADIDRIDAQLGKFTGRIRRDQWVEQAKLIEGGDASAYEAKFGKG